MLFYEIWIFSRQWHHELFELYCFGVGQRQCFESDGMGTYIAYIWPVVDSTNFDEIKNYVGYKGNHKVDKSLIKLKYIILNNYICPPCKAYNQLLSAVHITTTSIKKLVLNVIFLIAWVWILENMERILKNMKKELELKLHPLNIMLYASLGNLRHILQ